MEQSPLCYVALECLESHHCNELRSSCKPACQRTAFFLKASLPTDCVLAPLRQAARSALRSDKLQGVRCAQPVGKVVLMSSDAQPWQQVSFHACYWSYSIWACFIQQ